MPALSDSAGARGYNEQATGGAQKGRKESVGVKTDHGAFRSSMRGMSNKLLVRM